MKLVILCKNKSFGESLAFSIRAILGLETHILHQANRRMFAELNRIGIKNNIILLDDGLVGVNYPALIDDINKEEPGLQVLLGDSLATIIPLSTMRALGCDAILNDKVGLAGIINSILCFRCGEVELDVSKDPFSRLSDGDRNFLLDVHYLSVSEIKKKHGVTQQRIYARKMDLFKKIHLSDSSPIGAFRALCHLYQV